jgi:hypothetical protein
MDAKDRIIEELDKFRQQFRYGYVGGGYFRDMSVPKGTNADIKHGDEVISKFCEDFVQYLSKTTTNE